VVVKSITIFKWRAAGSTPGLLLRQKRVNLIYRSALALAPLMGSDSTFLVAVDEDARRLFEAAWRVGRPIPIEEALPPPEDPRYLATLEELVQIELEMLWKRNGKTSSDTLPAASPAPVEVYLARFPQLKQREIVLRLLKQEYGVRHLHGDRPSLDQYRRRFPDVVFTGAEIDATMRPVPVERVQELPRVSGYDILGTLGRGGMGVVYKARQLGLNRLVALKTILAGAHASAEDLIRFLHEAESVARLQHPHIVQIYEIGQEGGRPYFVMEFVESGSLAERLRGRTPLPPRASAELLVKLAEAAEYAHQRGIVHRDLKPANILLAPNPKAEGRKPKPIPETKEENARSETRSDPGVGNSESASVSDLGFRLSDFSPKVSDFGLAKHFLGGSGSSAGGILTQTGDILGTPSYMAPEQARGKTGAVGPAADVYSLGAILYEMLTGRPPFAGETPLDTVEQVIGQEPVPLTRLQPKVPRDLQTVCLKCLQKDPGKRYASAQALADDLGRFLRDEPILARPVGQLERFRRWCRRNPVVASLTATVFGLLVAVAVAASVAAFWLQSVARDAENARRREAVERERAVRQKELAVTREKEAERARAAADTARLQTLTTLADMYTGYGLITHVLGDPARAVLWFAEAARLDQDPERQHASQVRFRTWSRYFATPVAALPHDGERISQLAFHPGGRHVLTVTARQRYLVWDLNREKPLPWAKGTGEAVGAAWTPDGRSLVLATAAGNVEIRAFPSGEVREHWSHQGPLVAVTLSADGRFLALAGSQVRVRDLLKGGFATPGLPHPRAVVALTFNARGDRLATACADGTARVFAVGGKAPRAQPLFPPVPHRQDAAAYGVLSVPPVFIDQGRGLITITGSDRVGWWDAEKGAALRTVLARNDAGDPFSVFVISATSDGSYFAMGGFSGALIWDAVGRKQIGKFLAHQNYVTALAFSPDGRALLTAGEDRRAGLWSLASGQSLAAPLMHQASLRLAAYSPDGRSLALAQVDGLVRVWAPPRGYPRNHRLPHDGVRTFARLSPDGRYVLATGSGWWHNSLRTTRVYEVATGRPGGPLLEVGGLVTDAALSPDGRHVGTLCSLAGTEEERYAPQVLPEGKAGRLQIWDWQTGKPIFDPLPLPAEPRGLAYSADGKHLAAICAGGQVLLVDPATGKATRRLEHGCLRSANNTYPSVMFSQDGASLLTWGTRETLRVWDTATGKPRYAPLVHDSICFFASLSADGKLLVTSSWDQTARVWDFKTGRPLSRPLSHPEWVFSACFARDGQHVLTGCRDGLARVWDWRRCRIVGAPLKHTDVVFSAAFTPDERWVVTASRDHTARVWHRETGKPATPFFELHGDVWNALVTPDGRYAVLAGWARQLVAWSLDDLAPGNDVHVNDLCLLGEVLSGHRLLEGSAVGLTSQEWLDRWRAWRGKRPSYGQLDDADAPAWHRQQAEECAAEGQWTAAVWYLDRLLAAVPRDVDARAARGRIHLGLNQWQLAAADFSAVIELQPESWEPRFERGLAHLLAGKHAEAIADFSAALRLDPHHAMVLARRGWAYLKQGEHEKAVADCDAAVKLDPIFALAYYTRGLAHKALGHAKEGEADYQKAVQLDPAIGK
jgi:serine/threonine protein kinase/WD40 repeat protein/regulator of sirC expression with transglutaminase-like and TPR domain